jgi:hypothetical protein
MCLPGLLQGIALFLYVYEVLTSQETHLSLESPVTWIALLSLYLDNVRSSEETPYRSPRPVTGIPLLLYVDDVRTSQEKHPQARAVCYGDGFTLLTSFQLYFYYSFRRLIWNQQPFEQQGSTKTKRCVIRWQGFAGFQRANMSQARSLHDAGSTVGHSDE